MNFGFAGDCMLMGASFYTFTVEKVTQILGIRDDLFTVAQDPIVLEVSAS